MYSISLFISNNVVLISLILCYWCTVAFIITMDCWAMCYCCLCLCFSHTHIVTVVLFWFYFYWHSRLLALFFISSFCMVPSTFHLLSEWGQYVGANRLAQLNQMDQVQHVWAPVQTDSLSLTRWTRSNMSEHRCNQTRQVSEMHLQLRMISETLAVLSLRNLPVI